MSGPFREMFVELSAEAFAIAKAIGEQAIKAAEEKKVFERVPAAIAPAKGLDLDYIGPRVAHRYGWTYVESRRNRATDDVSWIVRLKCEHHHVVTFPCRALFMRMTSEAFEYLLDHLDEHAHERSCYCVQLERFCASCSRRLHDDTPTKFTPLWRNGEPSGVLTCADSDCASWAMSLRHIEREARLSR